MTQATNRRRFLQSSAATAAGLGLTTYWSGSSSAKDVLVRSPNERLVLGWIGAGIRYHNIIESGCNYGPCAAVCDVDAVQRGRGVQAARLEHYKHKYPINIYDYEDYRRVLDRADIDAVVIGTPDHWHTKIAIEAMQAGKDVYCEKPLTLTIREGRQIAEAVSQTGRILQVGTQQRTEYKGTFATAAAMARAGRAGKMQRVTCAIGGSMEPSPIPQAEVPKHLNWDMWLGQAPLVEYRATPEIGQDEGYGAGHPFSRTHNYFRWWYEYSGGKLTDWGAHHVDIAMWGLDKGGADIGPYTIEPLSVTHPNPLNENGTPKYDDRFNAATKFHVRVTFADGIELDIRDSAEDDLGFDNGIMFQGDQGRFFVNRGKLTGAPVEELENNPLPDNALRELYGRTPPTSQMSDFVECVKKRQTPASDVESHHRHLTVCHATNIAMRLGRKLTFDPATEQFVGDAQANTFVAREQRKGYEVNWPAS